MPTRDSGAFSSLLAGLVSAGLVNTGLANNAGPSFLAGLNAEEPLAPGSNAAPVPSRAKGKDTKSGENNSSTGKGEPKAKSGLVQAMQEPTVIKPPILFSVVSDDRYSQSSGTSPSGFPSGAAPNGQAESTGTSATLTRPSGASITPENEAAPSARIAFGLRLTTSNPESSAAIRWTAPETQTGQVLNMKPNTSAPESVDADHQLQNISSTPISRDANSGASGSSLVRNNSEPPFAALFLDSRQSDPSHTNVPDLTPVPGSGGGDVDNPANKLRATETSLAGAPRPGIAASSQVASDPIQASSGDSVNQKDSPPSITARGGPPQGSDSGSKGAALSIPSGPLADAQTANPQAAENQNPSEVDRQQKPNSQNTLSKPADPQDATAASAPVRERVVLPPVEKPGDAGTASIMRRSPMELRRDFSESIHNGSGESAASFEPQAPPAQASAGTDVRTGRSAGDPARATSSQTTEGSLSQAASRAISSQAPASQATASRATASQITTFEVTRSETTTSETATSETATSETATSQATASQATKVSNEPEMNAAPQPPPARQISLKLTGEDSSSVNVEVSERAGKVQVAVRTADPDLAKSLRTDLGDLVGRLESKGFKTDAWVPTALRHTAADAPGQSGSTNSQSGERQAGSGTGQRQERQGQNGSSQRQQARWKAQMEETLSTEESKTNEDQ
jgi:hypothetical protein